MILEQAQCGKIGGLQLGHTGHLGDVQRLDIKILELVLEPFFLQVGPGEGRFTPDERSLAVRIEEGGHALFPGFVF